MEIDEQGKYCVYMHTSPSKKVYIGITRTSVEKRWRKNGSGYKKQQYFWRAIQKYGWDNFKHEILYEHLTKDEAEILEINLIKQYKSNQKDFGYNIENGGNSIGKISDETRKKISEANKGRESPNKGKTFDDDFKRKVSEAMKGKLRGHILRKLS
jgi:group I intron endonuclease